MPKLSEIDFNQIYVITSVDDVDDVFNSRVSQLGLIVGAEIELKNKAPIFRDPLLFNVGESQVALTKEEAAHFNVEMKN
jgi:Fe2+ transport system protein FeoA